MDKVTQYRHCVQKLLSQYTKDDISDDEVEVQLIFDTGQDQYQWMNVGWRGCNRIYYCIVHFDIKIVVGMTDHGRCQPG